MIGKAALLFAIAIVTPANAMLRKQVSLGDRTAIQGGLMNSTIGIFKGAVTSIFCANKDPDEGPDGDSDEDPVEDPIQDSIEDPTDDSTEDPTADPTEDLPDQTSYEDPDEDPGERPDEEPDEGNVLWDQIGKDIYGATSDENAGNAVAISNDGRYLCVGGNSVLHLYYEIEGSGWMLGGNKNLLRSIFPTVSPSPSTSSHPTRTRTISSWSGEYMTLAPTESTSPTSFLLPLVNSLTLSFSADGLFLIVGEPGGPFQNGAVNVFTRDDQHKWEPRGETLFGEKKGDEFGASVGISRDGKIIVVGASQIRNNGPGCVKSYGQTLDDWMLTNSITGSSDGSAFGASVDVASDGSTLIIGAPGDENHSGSVYVYYDIDYSKAKVNMLDSFRQKIDGEAGDSFGALVAISDNGSRFAVSAFAGNYVKLIEFEEKSNSFKVIGEPIFGNAGTFFGHSLSLSGDGSRLSVGSPLNDDEGSGSGKVFMYAINDNNWKSIGEIAGEAYGDHSGDSVALSVDGKVVAIGAPLNTEAEGVFSSGQVRVFKSS